MYLASVRSTNGAPVNPVGVIIRASSLKNVITRLGKLPWADQSRSSVLRLISAEEERALEETLDDATFVGKKGTPAWCFNTEFGEYFRKRKENHGPPTKKHTLHRKPYWTMV